MRSQRAFYLLVGVTVLAVVAAIVSRRPLDETPGAHGLLLPDLGARLEQVRFVEVRTAGDRLRLARTDDGWVARNENDYPAREARVRQLILGISGLQRLARKTSDPDRYSSLDLTDVERPGSRAVQVTLLTAENEPLTRILVGKTQDFQSFGRSRYFVRGAGEAQSWLVEGVLPPVLGDVGNWLEQELLPGIDAADIRTLRVSHPDGEKIEIHAVNGENNEGGFRLAGANGEVADQNSLNAMVDTFQRLALKKIQDVSAVDTGEEAAFSVEASTFEGMLINARFTRLETDYGVELEARRESGVDPAGNDGATADDSPGKQRVDDLNKRWSGRLFTVSQYALDALAVKRSNLVRSPDAPKDP